MDPSPSTQLHWTALSDIGRRRKNNEDAWGAFALGPVLARLSAAPKTWPAHGFLLCVSDGMGGAEAGEDASALCVQHLSQELHARCRSADPAEALQQAFVATHEAVVQAAQADPAKSGMGATLSALWLRPDGKAVFGHIGDTRLYRGRHDAWVLLTEDQNVGAGLVRRGEMSAEQVSRLRYRSMLEQVMGGDGAPIRPQIGEFTWEPGDAFALCSDGLHGPLHDELEEPLGEALGGRTLEAGARKLVDAANDAGGPDNITVILARLVPE